MAWGDPSDYWFNRVPANPSPLPALQLGAELVQQRAAQAMREKQYQLQAAQTAIAVQESISKQELQTKILAGEAELATALASSFRNGFSADDPEFQMAIWDVAQKHPTVMSGPAWRGIMDLGPKAEEARIKANYYRGLISAKEVPKTTAAMTNLDSANAKEKQADAIEKENPELADALRRDATLLRSTITAPTETLETTYDEMGRPSFRVTRGPQAGKTKEPGAPTTATATQIQQRMLAAEKTVGMGAQLLAKLTPADIGVRGNVNQVVVNEGLSQLFPALQKGSVTDARTLLGQFNELAIKAIASDPRISDKDRKRYEEILPGLGPVESIDSAKEKIRTFLNQFRETTKIDAKTAGVEPPKWALSVDELKAKIKSGEMSEDEAVQIMVKYH